MVYYFLKLAFSKTTGCRDWCTHSVRICNSVFLWEENNSIIQIFNYPFFSSFNIISVFSLSTKPKKFYNLIKVPQLLVFPNSESFRVIVTRFEMVNYRKCTISCPHHLPIEIQSSSTKSVSKGFPSIHRSAGQDKEDEAAAYTVGTFYCCLPSYPPLPWEKWDGWQKITPFFCIPL